MKVRDLIRLLETQSPDHDAFIAITIIGVDQVALMPVDEVLHKNDGPGPRVEIGCQEPLFITTTLSLEEQ